jgi:hypothetical protein
MKVCPVLIDIDTLDPQRKTEIACADLLAACDTLEISGRAVADIMHRKGEQDDPMLSERLSELWQACNSARAVINAVNNTLDPQKEEED